MTAVRTVLVANRGEIARRVFATCRALGLGTVAVCSDPDADAPYVREADAAVRLPGAAPAETYLDGAAIVAAAGRAGADAVHPGYGFLSENADFAQAVLDAGLTWIGPPPGAIRAMGSKVEAKRLVAAAGVPVLTELDPAALTATDLPVLVKASAGGGGRGMRIVADLAELTDALAAARAEAASAFGDPTVFCEPYLAAGHHIEVQVFADTYGTVWTIGERECSIQRRHQKVVEETPSPLVERHGEPLRARLSDAARAATAAVGYVGAGTIEFIADGDGRFFFLEMNTRLQVEHPVTEATTGLDLVALQLHVAQGGRLAPDPPSRAGHAIEARLYAEDPAAGGAPQSGVLRRLAVPDVSAGFGPGSAPSGVRVDAGVEDGDTVGVHYDPMLAKVIAWAPTRGHCTALLAATLRRALVHGLGTNRDLLVRVLTDPRFAAGETDTAFLDRPGLTDPLADAGVRHVSALAAALAGDAASRRTALLPGVPANWRNVPSQPTRVAFDGVEVAYRLTRDGLQVEGRDDLAVVHVNPDEVVLEIAGVRHRFAVARYPDEVAVDSPLGPVRLRPVPRFVDPATAQPAGSLTAPMPATVAEVLVARGDTVVAGQPLLWLEAMKMRHRVDAPHAGVVHELAVTAGQQVDVAAVLAVLTTEDSTEREDG